MTAASLVETKNGSSKETFVSPYTLMSTIRTLFNEREITKESTGFTNNTNIQIYYDSVSRTVTLNGDFEAYYKGEKLEQFKDGWVSTPHADVPGNYFLHFCDGVLEFDTSPWTYDCLHIAFVQYNTHKIGIKETHGLMQWQVHKELHEVIGTYKVSGGVLSDFTIGSTVNRNPNISDIIVKDEDLESVIPQLTNKLYTQRYLAGSGATRSFNVDANTIIPVLGSQPYYNQFNGTEWVQTLFPNNNYGAIFVVAVPTTDDTNSRKFRFMFVQPQKVSGTLSEIQALSPANLTHGDSTFFVSEFVFFAKIIVRYTAGDWSISEVQYLNGTRLSQLTVPGGSSGGGVWGTIVGNINDQLDLKAALDQRLSLNGGELSGSLGVNGQIHLMNPTGITNALKIGNDSNYIGTYNNGITVYPNKSIGGTFQVRSHSNEANYQTNLEVDGGITYLNAYNTDSALLAMSSQRGFAGIELYGDTLNEPTEQGGAYVKFSQDGDEITGTIGMTQNPGKDGRGDTFTGTTQNSMVIGSTKNSDVYIGRNAISRLGLLDDSYLTIYSPTGSVQIGSANTGYLHLQTDRPSFYMNKSLAVTGSLLKGPSYNINVPGVFIQAGTPAATQVGDIWVTP